MSHLLDLVPGAVAALCRRRPQTPLPYPPQPQGLLTRPWHYRPPEPEAPPPPPRVPIPGTDKVQLVQRQDCVRCGGEHDAHVRANGYQCLNCDLIVIT